MKKLAFYGIVIAATLVLLGYQFFHGGHSHIDLESGQYVDAVGGNENNVPVRLLAFGDVMLDRQVRLFINQNGSDYPFKNITELLSGNDIIFTNLEGSVTNNSSKTVDLKGKVLHFTFNPMMMQTLRVYGFNVVSLANNHAYDFLRAGYLETQQHLKNADISYFGDPYNTENLSVTKEIKGLKIAFVGYHEFYDEDITSVVNEIARLQTEADLIIVAPHWGIEYALVQSSAQRAKAHAFVDAGADIVLGAHPHVVQPIEIYNGKPIFYSLGNFIFDQDFSYNTTHGLAVHMELEKESATTTTKRTKATFNLIPMTIKKSQAGIADESERSKMLSDLSKNSVVSLEIKEGIEAGRFELSL